MKIFTFTLFLIFNTTTTFAHDPAQGTIDPSKEFITFIYYGAQHIWQGTDHIFFVLLLVLTTFMPIIEKKPTKHILRIIKLATAFTAAHSITLCLSVLNLYTIPSKIIEWIIVVSIIFVGLNNIYKFFNGREWLLVFCFGLFHGWGFAEYLKTLMMSSNNIAIPLIGFNVGVEIGQLIFVAVSFPLIFLYSKKSPHVKKTYQIACWIILSISSVWLIERTINLFT